RQDPRMRRLKQYGHGASPSVFCHVRGKLIRATPEEKVRQDVLRTLTDEYGYPPETLRPEEPIGRGTIDRRRADVLVHLLKTVTDRHAPRVEDAAPMSRVTHSLAAHEVHDRLGAVRDATVVRIPDELRLGIDGERVNARVLGFTEKRGGVGLSLALASTDAQRLGGPETLSPLVVGLGLTEEERELAQELGLPNLAFDSSANKRFLQVAMRALAQLRLSRPFNKVVEYDEGITSGLSPDGRTGWM